MNHQQNDLTSVLHPPVELTAKSGSQNDSYRDVLHIKHNIPAPNQSSSTPIAVMVSSITIPKLFFNKAIVSMIITIPSKANALSTIQTKDKDHDNH